MAQSAAPDLPRTRSRLAALAGLAGDGQGDPERNPVADDDRPASAGLPPNPARGPPPDPAAALRTKVVGAEGRRGCDLFLFRPSSPRLLQASFVPRTGDWQGTWLLLR